MHRPFTKRTGYSEWCRGEWGEEKERGGITRPFFMRRRGAWGSNWGRKIPALIKTSGRLVSRCQQAGHWCVTAELNLQHLLVLVAAARPAHGGVLHAGLSLCLAFSADVTSPVGRFGGDLSLSPSMPLAWSVNVSKSRASLFHVLKWAEIFQEPFTLPLKGWNF